MYRKYFFTIVNPNTINTNSLICRTRIALSLNPIGMCKKSNMFDYLHVFCLPIQVLRICTLANKMHCKHAT